MGKENELTFSQKASIQWNGFRKFLWNSEEKTVLGRNGKSWAQISLFYLVFYTCLALFWGLMLFVFLQTIQDEQPKWTSYIGTPGLFQIPQMEDKFNPIKFDKTNEKTYARYVKLLDNTYNAYKDNYETGNVTEECIGNEIRDQPEDRNVICEFDVVEQFAGVCEPPNYGYDEGKPCIFVGLNRVWGWIPENYEEDDIPAIIKETHQENFITIACEVYKGSQNDLNSTVIAPEAGLSFKYYPYLGARNDDYKDNYWVPLVAIKFDLTKKNSEVRLICKSYAGNILPGNGLFDTSYASELRIDMTISS